MSRNRTSNPGCSIGHPLAAGGLMRWGRARFRPAGAAIGGSGIGGMAAEGALAGVASSAIQDPNNLGGIAGGALYTGRRAWRSAGVLTKGALTPGCRRLSASRGRSIRRRDRLTAKDSADVYAKLHQFPADPQAIAGALKGALTDLDLERSDRHVAWSEELNRQYWSDGAEPHPKPIWAAPTVGNGRSMRRRSANGIQLIRWWRPKSRARSMA